MQSDSLFEYVFASDRHVVRRTLGLAHLCLPVSCSSEASCSARHRSTPLHSEPLNTARLLSAPLARTRAWRLENTPFVITANSFAPKRGFDSSPSACSALVARTWAPRATLAANRHQEASVARASRSMQGATPFTDALRARDEPGCSRTALARRRPLPLRAMSVALLATCAESNSA